MRKKSTLLLLLALVLTGLTVNAQNLQTASQYNVGQGDHRIPGLERSNDLRGVTTCNEDTLQYSLFKASAIENLLVFNSSTLAAAQYYDCPGPISITGFQFFALSLDAPVLTVNVNVYAAGADSLPTGAPLLSTTTTVDTTFGGGTLGDVLRTVNFAAPLAVSQPYVIAIENPTADRLVVYTNDFTAGDGDMEWAGLVNVGQWAYGYQVLIGGGAFDADWLIEPFVQYDVAATINSVDCYEVNSAVTFNNGTTPVVNNKMYSVAAALNVPEDQYTWDYGDGTAPSNSINGLHTYTTGGMSYTVSLIDTIFQWSGTCVSDTSKTMSEGVPPVASFTAVSGSGNEIILTNNSTGGTLSYLWDFGDGATSTTASPTYVYPNPGTYTICLSATDACGTDSTCTTVTVGAVSIESELAQGVQLYPNPATDEVYVALDLVSDEEVTLNIYNLHGAKLQSIDLGTLRTDRVAIDLNQLPAGSYLMEVRTANDRAVKRFSVMD